MSWPTNRKRPPFIDLSASRDNARSQLGHDVRNQISRLMISKISKIAHDLSSVFLMNAGPDRPTANFPKEGTNTPLHLLWMSNLFVDLTRIGQNPTLRSYESYISIASADHRAAIANTLVMWYMFLGGHVEEETFWAIDKSYALTSLPLIPASSMLCMAVIRWKSSSPTCPQN